MSRPRQRHQPTVPLESVYYVVACSCGSDLAVEVVGDKIVDVGRLLYSAPWGGWHFEHVSASFCPQCGTEIEAKRA